MSDPISDFNDWFNDHGGLRDNESFVHLFLALVFGAAGAAICGLSIGCAALFAIGAAVGSAWARWQLHGWENALKWFIMDLGAALLGLGLLKYIPKLVAKLGRWLGPAFLGIVSVIGELIIFAGNAWPAFLGFVQWLTARCEGLREKVVGRSPECAHPAWA